MVRRSEKKAATQADILSAARRLFSAHGWEGTTTKMVAEEAGVAVGTVFLHFPEKTTLLEAALREQITEALAEAQASLPPVGILAQLTHLAEALYRMYARDPALSRVLVKESLFLTEGEAAAASRAQLAAFSHQVTALLDAARIRGEVDNGVDPRLGATAFLALYVAVLIGGLRDGLPPEAQAHLLRALLAQYLQPRKKP